MVFPLFPLGGGKPTFELFREGESYLPSVDRLERNLTINSTTVAPTFIYYGGQANATNWIAEVGETLTLQAGTEPTYNAGSPLLGVNDDSVKFNGGGYYQASNGSIGSISTEDFVFHLIVKTSSSGSSQYIVDKSAIGYNGWGLYTHSTSIGMFWGGDTPNYGTPGVTGLIPDTWYDVWIFGNRDENSSNGVGIYVNGGAKTAASNMYGASGADLDSGKSLTIGALTTGGNTSISNIELVEMWKQSDWHQAGASGPAEWATIAAERFHKLIGTYPQRAIGTKLPTVATRASTAYLDKVEDVTTDTTTVIADGDMEAADTSSWTPGGTVTLSKESGARTGGSGTLILRVTNAGGTNPYARQSILTTGQRHRITGWARGDGTVAPAIYNEGTTLLWSGTSSNTWQYFDFLFTPTAGTNLRFYAISTSVSEYTEFDDVTVYEIPAGATDHNLLSDGDMEDTEVDAWSAVNNATLSKQSGARTGGSGGLVLRVARNATNNPYAKQDILTVGEQYRMTGWARSDGNVTPRAYLGTLAAPSWQGTTSTDWQYFDIVATASIITTALQAITSTGTEYAEFDDVTITKLPNRKIYQVGNNWMRYCDRQDSEGTRIKGFLPEEQRDNLIKYSESFGSGAWFPIDTGDGILIDADMETAGVGDWTAAGSGTLTKETNPRTGSTGSQCLRVTYGGGAYPYASQNVLTVGVTYRITGWARGDGNVNPSFQQPSGSGRWAGTSSTDWQYFDFIHTAESSGDIGLMSINASTGEYTEWDDILIYPLSEAPNKEDVAVELIADSTDGGHGLSQDVTLTAATYTVSCFAKAGDEDWLYISDDTVANAYSYFDLSLGAIGTTGAGCTAYIENWGDQWMRCSISFTGTAAAHTIKVQSATANEDLDFAGDGSTTNTYIFGAQVEQAEYPSSYITTEDSTATRSPEELYYKGDDGNLGGVGSGKAGTIALKGLIESYDITRTYQPVALTLMDGTDSNNALAVYVDKTTNDQWSALGRAGTQYITTATSVRASDNVVHDVKFNWKVGEANLYVDDDTDTDSDVADIPDDLDRIFIGKWLGSGATGQQLNGIISALKIYPFPTKK